MLKIIMTLNKKKYADYYQGRYANAIITNKNVYWLDTDISSNEFHKGLMEYLLNEGKEDLLKKIKETLNKPKYTIHQETIFLNKK